jgi:recombinational DNA repair protein (RecF pathway)
MFQEHFVKLRKTECFVPALYPNFYLSEATLRNGKNTLFKSTAQTIRYLYVSLSDGTQPPTLHHITLHYFQDYGWKNKTGICCSSGRSKKI